MWQTWAVLVAALFVNWFSGHVAPGEQRCDYIQTRKLWRRLRRSTTRLYPLVALTSLPQTSDRDLTGLLLSGRGREWDGRGGEGTGGEGREGDSPRHSEILNTPPCLVYSVGNCLMACSWSVVVPLPSSTRQSSSSR